MTASNPQAADEALRQLPAAMQERLTELSPINHIQNLRAPLIVLLHDVGDQVIPIGEFAAAGFGADRARRRAVHRNAVLAP